MPDSDTPAQQQTDAILEALDGSGPATTVELATALDTHPMTVERYCQTLQRDGCIRRCTGGMYTLVETSTERLPTRLAD
ncbi:DeoR family transcriptional regulator [Natronorubrum bangense]|uniref:DeoR family transcriptional regulator n=2 Tax=Natronorubrum bangense TaxID=61858 RepID=L9W650_9EURY|nr:helix-turn-helix domain-containing protein [Natronorubrum bangense]ELY44940.1 DeoR family transcriptional regulator [Natronorubrum bangense JCM 10635]QCC54972.1 DeoR family transcriptional regulator [Natronorubrum bangense]